MDNNGDDEYVVPLVDQRVFGAGLKRKRVAFVPASSTENASADKPTIQSSSNRYLDIVLKKTIAGPDVSNAASNAHDEGNKDLHDSNRPANSCEICGQPLTDVRNHDRSIAHQICLQHSHPPSHLDRTRKGLKYLESHGWDPDARTGLGSRQEGIRIPIKAKEKYDTAGLREHDDGVDPASRKQKKQVKQEEIVKLDAKKIRKIEEEKGRRTEKLRRSIYGDDLSRYLGPNG